MSATFQFVSCAGRRRFLSAILLLSGLLAFDLSGRAQVTTPTPPADNSDDSSAMGRAVMDNSIFYHFLFDQLEGRTSGSTTQLRWDGEGWIGTDTNKLWLRTEGFANRSGAEDADVEAFYDRPLPRLRYFDWQVGLRQDFNSGSQHTALNSTNSDSGHTWAAIGLEGFAPYLFEVAPTFYIRDGGNLAGRITIFYDVLFTQRLIAEPEAELDFYSKDDPAHGIGSGLSSLDTGIRLRYEFSRKFAPYIGFVYNARYGNTATYARNAGQPARDPQFVFGVRLWY